MAVKGFQLHITVDIDFEKIMDFIDENDRDTDPEVDTVDDLIEMWDNGQLQQFLEDNFGLTEIVNMSGEQIGNYPLDISSGYLG